MSIFPQMSAISLKTSPKICCKVCGKETKSCHFGAISCSACAAFFRRSVASQKTPRCKLSEQCKLVNLFPRMMCQYCRLIRCLAVGMQPCKVRLLHHRDSSFCDSSTTCILSPRSNSKQTEVFFWLQATILESLVCTAYTNSTSLSDYLFGSNQHSLFDHATTTWKDMDVCNIITKNNKTNLSKAFSVSDQFVDVNLQFIEKFYQLDESFRSSEWIKIFKKPLWQKVWDLAKILENNQLNEYKFAALAHSTLIQIAGETLGNVAETQIQPSSCLTKLAKDIQQCYPLKTIQTTGSLMQLVDEMQKLRKIYDMHVLIIFSSQKPSPEEHSEQTFVNPLK